MCSVSLETDNRTYFITDNLHKLPQICVMTIVNLLSASVNCVMFYVTVSRSKKESKLYRIASFLHNLSLFLAQFYWGTLLNPIPLLPLPGVLAVGVVSPVFNTFVLLLVWILIFAFSIIMMYVILLIRLRVLARKDGWFHFRDFSYFLMFIFLCSSIFIPILSRVLPHYSSISTMANHVDFYYPKCLPLAFEPGFFIFVNTCKSTKGVYVVLISLLGGASLYLVICGMIIYEIRVQSIRWNINKTRNHIRVLKHTIVQNIFRFLFLAIAPAVVLRNAFQFPETNTVVVTLIANAFFVAAPVPCAIVILIQNDTYRSFLFSKLTVFRLKKVSNVSYIIERSQPLNYGTCVNGPSVSSSKKEENEQMEKVIK